MKTIVAFEQVSFQYPHQPDKLFSDLSWSIQKGTWCSILGPNGVGKSTVLKLIAGLLEPTSGRVIRQFDVNRMVYLAQYTPFDGSTMPVSDVVRLSQRAVPSLATPFEKWKDIFGLHQIWDQRVNELSVGQRQRLILGLYLLKPADILILDEPTSGCDIAHANQMYGLIDSIRQQFCITILHVSHEIHQVLMFAKEIVCLGLDGHWHRHVGDISHESLEDAYGCELGKLVKVHKDSHHTEGGEDV